MFDANTPIDELIEACADAELAAAELRRRDALLKALLAWREEAK